MIPTLVRKICILGNYSTGKTSLMLRKKQNVFTQNVESTIGAGYFIIEQQIIDSNSRPFNLKLEFWDTAGSERYQALSPMYFRNSHIILIVYDVNDIDSMYHIKKWIREIRQTDIFYNIILVGNKCDLEGKNMTEIIDYAEENDMKHLLVSCKLNIGIDNLYNTMNDLIIEKYKNDIDNIFNSENTPKLNLNLNSTKFDEKCCL